MPGTISSRPTLVVFFGLIASGKSFLSRRWAGKYQFPYHNTDVVRKELAGVKVDSQLSSDFNQAIYSHEQTRRTYDELISRARKGLLERDSDTVVLDGSYRARAERLKVVETFSRECDIVFIYCYCSLGTTKDRLAARASDLSAVSDGRWEIFQQQVAVFDQPESMQNTRLLKLDTEKRIEELVQRVDDFIYPADPER